MRYTVSIKQTSSNEYIAQTIGEPECHATGQTREEALNAIRDEIRYHVEFCPCSFVGDDYVQLDVTEG